MSQQYGGGDMYQDYSSNRSPNSVRAYGNGLSLNRQTSRHFDNSNYGPVLFSGDEHIPSQYETSDRYARLPSMPPPSNYPYESHTWNYGGAPAGANMMGGTGRVKPSTRRTGLPPTWMGEPMPPVPNINNYPMNGQHNAYGMQQGNRSSPPNENDELIPTAIVIKNIPFAVKKEQLIQMMTDMRLPLPYAFNYHFDSGVFRGLAFANFTTAEETRQVIQEMNHMDLQGRKLRVEYKKMLPVQERERIERDKREKRGQLQEQHQPLPPGQIQNPLHTQSSLASLSSNHHPTSPSPVSLRGRLDLDMNDPTTLGYYGELMVFKTNREKETLIFPSTVSPADRRTIHTLAHHMGLEHRSEGQGDTRCVQILKRGNAAISPPAPQLPATYYNQERRQLNRAATIDFSETRETGYHNHTLGRQGSGLLDIPGSPGLGGLSAAHNLRAAKSFADLRSYTPSPVPSTASFPAGLTQNISRYTDYGHGSAASGTPNLTPTSAGGGMNTRDESFLLNGLGNMAIGYDRPSANRANTGRIGQERETHTPNAGPIGSQRPSNGNTYDDGRNGTTAVERQPRGPPTDWGKTGGFSRPRQNGHVNRGSGELDPNSFENSWDDNRAQDSSDRTAPSNTRYM